MIGLCACMHVSVSACAPVPVCARTPVSVLVCARKVGLKKKSTISEQNFNKTISELPNLCNISRQNMKVILPLIRNFTVGLELNVFCQLDDEVSK